MADARSLIVLTTGKQINVDGGVDLLSRELAPYFISDRVSPLVKIMDTDGRAHLINVNEIVEVEGPE